MANTTVEFFDANGDKQIVNLPAYAMESTLQALLGQFTKIEGINTETKESLIKLGEATKKVASTNKDNQTTNEKLFNDQLDALKRVNKNIKENTKAQKEDVGFFKQALKDTGSILSNVFRAGLSLAGTALYEIATTGYGTGKALQELNRTGVLLGKSATQEIGSLAALGMSAADAGAIIGNYSQVVASRGVDSIVQAANTLGDITQKGSQFGLTMQDVTELMADEIKLRQTLGMIDSINEMQAAKNQKALMTAQLRAAQVLGKSMDDLEKASDGTLNNPIVVSALNALDMMGDGSEEAKKELDGFVNSVRKSQSEMVAMGFDQKLIDQLGNEMFDITAFMSESGQQLFGAFSAMGAEGAKVATQLSDINNAVDAGELGSAQQMIADLPGLMGESIGSMDAEQLKSFRAVAESIGGELGSGLLSSISEVRLFQRRMADLADATGADQAVLTSQFQALARGAASYDNALNTAQGAMATFRMGLAGLSVGPMNAFSELMVFLTNILSENMGGINDSITDLLHRLGFLGAQGDELGQSFKELIGERLKTLMGNIKTFIDNLSAEDILGFVDGAIEVAKGIGVVAGLVYDGLYFLGKFFGGDWFDSSESADWAKPLIETFEFISKALVAAFAVGLVKKAIGGFLGMFTMGTGAGGAGVGASAAGAVGKGVGKGAATLGTGVGKGIGGVLKGTASGLTAMGGVKVFAGIAALTALGAAMTFTIAPGFKAFTDLDWETMGKAIVGLAGLGTVAAVLGMFAGPALLGALALGAIGLALQLFPVDVLEGIGIALESAFNGIATIVTSVFSGIGEVIGKVSEAINSFKMAGAEADNLRMEGTTQAIKELAGIDSSQMMAISAGIDSIGSSLVNFSSAVGDNGFFGFGADGGDIDKQMEQVGVFKLFADLDAVAIQSSADALSSMVDVYTRFGGLDNTAIINTASAIKDLNDSMDTRESVGEMAVNLGKSIVDFGVNLLSGNSDSPSTESMSQVADTESGSTETGTSVGVLARIDDEQIKELVRVLKSIDSKTVA